MSGQFDEGGQRHNFSACESSCCGVVGSWFVFFICLCRCPDKEKKNVNTLIDIMSKINFCGIRGH